MKSAYRRLGFAGLPRDDNPVSRDLAGTLHIEYSELPLIADLDAFTVTLLS